MPSPPPQHIATNAYLPSRRSNSCSAVVINLAPVLPVGWPSAMAPPFTFTFSGSAPRSFCQARTTEAKASFTSKISISSMVRLALSRTFLVAGIGPFNIVTGSTPTRVVAKIFARGLRSRRSQAFLDAKITAAAPSETWELDPAVCISCPGTGSRLASDSSEVSLNPSSRSIVFFSPVGSNFSFKIGDATSTISRSNLFSFQACMALF